MAHPKEENKNAMRRKRVMHHSSVSINNQKKLKYEFSFNTYPEHSCEL